jgi:translocation and assembly module TamA
MRWFARSLAVLAVLAGLPARAADPQPYRVRIAPTEVSGMETLLGDSSTLLRLQDEEPVAPAALIARARADRDRFAAVLRSQGHFAGSVAIRAAGLDLTDLAAAAAIAALPADPPLEIVVTVSPGPLYTIDAVTVAGAEGLAPGLAVGDPARGADILAAEARLLDALRRDGHAYARLGERTLTVDHAARTMTVALRVEPGPRVAIGRIGVDGLSRIDRDFAAWLVAARTGRPVTPAELEAARRDLLDLGAFATVRARLAPAPGPDGHADVTLETVERPPRRIEVGGAYATSEGASLRARWLHRNLLGRAERLELGAEVSGLLERGFGDLGYRLDGRFARPHFLSRRQTFRLDAGALRERTDAYDRIAVTGGAALERRLSDRLSGSLGLAFERSRVEQAGVATTDTFVGVPATLVWEDAGNPLDSVRGTRARLELTPYPGFLGSTLAYTSLRATGSGYLDLAGNGRSVLAGRLIAAAAFGQSREGLPADRRVYAGGSGTVRGFAHQSIGPRADGRPLGGTTLLAGGVEFRQRIGGSWGAVAFLDAGGVGEGRAPDLPGRLAVGAGVGVRYYTAIGPVRVDVALPLAGKRPGDAAWQLYLGLGQAF